MVGIPQHGNLFQQNEDMKKKWKNILALFERLACSDKLVGGWPTPLKNMKVNWDYYSQYMKKIKISQTTNQQKNIGA